ncbi:MULTISPECIES: glycoside hydrolase family 20 protein [unclassified Carboxylicivirga]|uniref:glycoside hydrolase family 20 protein n=1 Tax=Carboxylicivirga TaxID=1628153 RepID=UPI003D354946
MKQMTGLVMVCLVGLLAACSAPTAMQRPLIPQPNAIDYEGSTFMLRDKTPIVVESAALAAGVAVFNEAIERHVGRPLEVKKVRDEEEPAIVIRRDEGMDDEAYRLGVEAAQVTIEAASAKGVFYALQTLLQMCPAEILQPTDARHFSYSIKGVRVSDKPAFKWRGMMLDVSRHFFTKEEVMQLIDYLAYHKINVFHWHLVDDQGWRIEIKKYPKLTSVGAWRVDREHLPWNARAAVKEGEKATYGGFYTQEDIKEVVAYAQKRFITVVPEIEMPGHTTSSLAAYPEYACNPGPFYVEPGGLWPITDIYCAGKDETFQFIEDVLSEVMELFPSKYIHIGGDEANKAEWERCAKCQARIKKEQLKDEHALQSYFIRRVENYLSAHNRVLIGWDEILEGGLAPNATVMSWRGFEGGIAAANSGHDVVMTPTSHCYLDYYQGPVDLEPVAFNGYLPLKRVYEFNPIPEQISPDKVNHILGGQGNLWTEHVADEEHMQYMAFPRMAALAEALWTKEEGRDWRDFSGRMSAFTDNYDKMGLHYATSMYTVQCESVFDEKAKTVAVALTTEIPDSDIRYTLDGTAPDEGSMIYTEPFSIDSSVKVVAASFIGDHKVSKDARVNLNLHKATAKPLEFTLAPHSKYAGKSKLTLVNSLRGTRNFSDGKWLGFEGNDMEVVIDLEEEKEIRRVSVGCLHETGSWIFLPKEIRVLSSLDGVHFEKVGATINNIPLQSEALVMDYQVEMKPTVARYVKVQAINQALVPEWHSAAGGASWLFVDEIIVE